MKTSIANELKRIASEHDGVLQPETVVQEARSKSSPLHDRFCWDDTQAAREYRIWQARQLINICVEVLPGRKRHSDVFVSLKQDRVHPKGGYRMTVDVLNDTQLRAVMLEEALEQLNAFQERYQNIKELAAVFAAIRKVRKAA